MTTSIPSDSPDSWTLAEAAFAVFLSRRRSEPALGFDDFCEDHRDLEPFLRELHRSYLDYRKVIESLPTTQPATADTSASDFTLPHDETRFVGTSEARLESLAAHPTSMGRLVGLQEIGRGGMGVILRVWDSDLRRPLAMKVAIERKDGMTSYVKLSDKAKVARFLEEAQITAQLDHPGVVPVHQVGVDEKQRLFFTMQIIKDGRDLKTVFDQVRRGAEGWSQVRVLGVLLKVCETVASAHSKGVVHRDLKPGNVMVGRFGEVYVLDWGLAKVHGRRDEPSDAPAEIDEFPTPSRVLTDREEDVRKTPDAKFCTRDGWVLGTPSYMPPEQALGQVKKIGPAADVYSVGAMLYELLAGRSPYSRPGVQLEADVVVGLISIGPPPPLRRLAPDAPPELVAICEKAMARQTKNRYANMIELADELRAFLEDRVVRAYKTGPVVELQKWAVRNRGLAAGIVLAVLVALIAALRHGVVQAGHNKAMRPGYTSHAIASLQEQASGFWPPHPVLVEEYGVWLDEARALLAEDEEWRAEAARVEGIENVYAEQVAEVLARLDSLANKEKDVGSLMESARRIGDESVHGPEAAKAWRRARATIASHDEYDGLDLAPVLGLLPLEPDPESGLWEFWHLQTGQRPERGEDGRWVIGKHTGMVFVLVPGGELFLSKYEMTQGQWKELTKGNPSSQHAGKSYDLDKTFDDRHPVEMVSWDDCRPVLQRAGLVLPAEKQWERAARAGSETPWWTGEEPESLWPDGRLTINVADGAAERVLNLKGQPLWDSLPAWRALGAPEDGYPFHAPVGSFPPNPWGFHDMLGNVSEWCEDSFSPDETRYRVVRGSDFTSTVQRSRVDRRDNRRPWDRFYCLGLRPALPLEGGRSLQVADRGPDGGPETVSPRPR